MTRLQKLASLFCQSNSFERAWKMMSVTAGERESNLTVIMRSKFNGGIKNEFELFFLQSGFCNELTMLFVSLKHFYF